MKIGNFLKKGIIPCVSQSYKPKSHQALDFGNPTCNARTSLVAVVDGIAGREAPKTASWLSKTGFTLKHSSGAFFLYQHAQLSVPVSSSVKRGQVIGYVDTAANQRKFGNKMKNGWEHLHLEIHPTGNWNYREQPLCYFDRKEVKYTKQPACTSTPLNYAGLADKHLKGGSTMNATFELQKRGNDLWMVKVTGNNYGKGKIVVTRGGRTTKYNFFNHSDKKLISGMDPLVYRVCISSFCKEYNNKPAPLPVDPCKKYIDENLKLKGQIGDKKAIIDKLNQNVKGLTDKLVKAGLRLAELEKEIEKLNKNYIAKVQAEVAKSTKTINTKLENCRKDGKKKDKIIKELEGSNLIDRVILFIKNIFK